MNSSHYIKLARRLHHEMLNYPVSHRWFLRQGVRDALDMARATLPPLQPQGGAVLKLEAGRV